MRLFLEQGYDATSIEQIAESAEVSPSTVFRYFPTKPDLVMYDDLDAAMIEAFRAQPSHLTAIEAFRKAFALIFQAEGGAGAMAFQLDRLRLIQTVPELRAAVLDDFSRTLQEITVLAAERAGRPVDDEVLALAGAVFGVAIAAWFAEAEGDFARMVDRLDTGLQLLETGFKL